LNSILGGENQALRFARNAETLITRKAMSEKLVVILSSTIRDLAEHRKEVLDACLRQGMFPKMMEHLPASDAEAISASLRLVDEADIYLGVFAHRYGYLPKENNPQQISVTEMEYNHAVERKIPRLIFVMGKDHLLTADDVEIENAAKLKAFKERIQQENIVNLFTSPADLRSHVINSLSHHREPDLNKFHYVSEIPPPPEPFIAHPYTLLQTHRLVGRQPELNLLTDWVTSKQEPIYQAHILNIVAIGGMGKSALTWKWFQDIAMQEMKPLAGRMWWSFYESDATFENFVTRALAYVTRRPLDEVQKIPSPEREAQLLAALDREPFLLVLDGLERILIAYARMDAAHLSDDDYDRQTANYVANAYGLPASAAQSFTGEHRLRKTADPRAGAFLRKLSTVQAARILVSTRLYPADLQTVTGEARGNCAAKFLRGLSDDDALNLWKEIGVSGSREMLLPLFYRIENHPLLIQSLATEVARYRQAPGDFDKWKQGNPDFNPFNLPLVQGKSHVLEFALCGLNNKARQALSTIAAFRMPASYDTLTALLIGGAMPCTDERELDTVLTELEDRGLVGWDKRANRYDLHPIVRGVVWSGLDDDARRGIYTNLHTHFEALPKIEDWQKVGNLEDLTPTIELYNTLIGLRRYEEAWYFYYERLFSSLQFKLSMTSKQVEFLQMFFANGLEKEPCLSNKFSQSQVLRVLAESYHRGGKPKQAIDYYHRCIGYEGTLPETELNVGVTVSTVEELISHLQMLSDAFYLTGKLFQSCLLADFSLNIARKWFDDWNQAIILSRIGIISASHGNVDLAENALRCSLLMFRKMHSRPREGGLQLLIAQLRIWSGNFVTALSLANCAWELAHVLNLERDFIRAARMQGAAALGLQDFATADERLHHALTRARQVNYVEEELPALIALAELRRQQEKPDEAREYLNDVWDSAERGPYPLLHADALNVLAQIERDAGNTALAIEAATKAYRLAWCDGPPFAYHWGLIAAQKHLQELGAPEPEMPPFDASKFEPMPEVEIDPEDEFHAGKSADE
jgi:tetratricopeptide (TPR) repeat protein